MNRAKLDGRHHRNCRMCLLGISSCKFLRELDLSDNSISNISEGRLPPYLQTLRITGNEFEALPQTLEHLPKLHYLYAGANRSVPVGKDIEKCAVACAQAVATCIKIVKNTFVRPSHSTLFLVHLKRGSCSCALDTSF